MNKTSIKQHTRPVLYDLVQLKPELLAMIEKSNINFMFV